MHGVDIIPPVAGLAPHWGVLFGNTDFSVPTKTGTYDDVVLADSKHRPLVPKILQQISKMVKQSDNLMFPELTLSGYEQLFRDFSKHHRLKAAIFTPHVIRHSGPSFDVMHGHRDLSTMQARGRWASFSPVSRYKSQVVCCCMLASCQQVSKNCSPKYCNRLSPRSGAIHGLFGSKSGLEVW